MLHFLKREANKTYTENGAATYVSTKSDCLDLFATIGALRHASDEDIIARFTRAYAEDADLAMKMLFFARDIRGGLGERRVFKVILKYLAEKSEVIIKSDTLSCKSKCCNRIKEACCKSSKTTVTK